ncbi:hypothetical protein BH11BAC2_BH11BAC2_10810 [soil metagenome]
MKSGRLQVILIASVALIGILIYISPSQVNSKSKSKEENTGAVPQMNGFSPDALLKSADGALDSTQKANLTFLEQALKLNGDKDTATLDQLGRFWDRQGIPAAAAIWFERKAEVVQSEVSFLDAAYRYFDAFKVAGDTGLRVMMVDKAIASYTKVLEKNPENLNAKTDLGACYAEGTSEPMKGILLLREVVAKDPEHEMAQLNLGMLSVKSGQLDKAIERFEKVITINPKRSEMYLYLGQVYLQKGDTAKAITYLETFSKKSDDYQTVTQVGVMLKQLKNKAAIQ